MAISDYHLIQAKHLRDICLTSRRPLVSICPTRSSVSSADAVVHNYGSAERERAPAFGGVLCTDAIWERWP